MRSSSVNIALRIASTIAPTIAPTIGLVAASLVVAAALGEAALRVARFEYAPTLENVEFGWPNPLVLDKVYRSDPDLFWVTRDYHERIERLEGVRPDVVFLGDSCTEWGRYPDFFVERHRAEHPQRPLVTATLGVAGWSSFQGLQQLRRDVVPLRPRAATFYFGWNDHWRAYGMTDSEIHEANHPALPGMRDLRLWQLVLKARLAWNARGGGEGRDRVPPEAFRANLRRIARLARANGIEPVLVTAPGNHERGAEPEHLAPRWLRDLDDLVPLHESYQEMVRDVARSEDAHLCDLAARFDRIPRSERSARLFASDGIHVTARGDELLAKFLYECFRSSTSLRAVLGG